jgi:hypothetical protein
MCIAAERDAQADTKHVKTLPRNVCSRTLIAIEFQSDHPPASERGNWCVHTLLEAEHPHIDLLVPPIATATELVTKQIF